MNFISNIFGGGSKKVINSGDKKVNLFSNTEKINKLLKTLEGINPDKIEKVLKEKKLDEKEVKSKTNKIQTFISGLIKYIENNNIPEIPVKSNDNKIPLSLPPVGQLPTPPVGQQVASVADGRKSRRSKRSTRRSKRTRRSRRSKRSKRSTRRSRRSKRSKRTTRRSKSSIKHMKIRSRKTKRM
jgi:hypothetical protein